MGIAMHQQDLDDGCGRKSFSVLVADVGTFSRQFDVILATEMPGNCSFQPSGASVSVLPCLNEPGVSNGEEQGCADIFRSGPANMIGFVTCEAGMVPTMSTHSGFWKC